MAIKGIVERIQRDTQAQIEKIKLEYQARMDEIEERAKLEAEKIINEAQNKSTAEKEKAYRRVLEHGRFEMRKKLLAKKVSLIEKEIEIIKSKIEKMEIPQQREFFALILANLGQLDGEILVGEDKNVFNEDFLDKVREIFSRRNLGNPNFKIVHTDQKFRGIYLVSGKIRYDLSLGAIVGLIREKYFDKVAQRLFEDK